MERQIRGERLGPRIGKREAKAWLERETAIWKECSKETPIALMHDKMWMPTFVPRACFFFTPHLTLTQSYLNAAPIDPLTLRLYRSIEKTIMTHFPLHLHRLYTCCGRLYFWRLMEYDSFTEDDEDARTLRAFTTACTLASLLMSLQRFLHLLNSTVPHAFDRFILVALESPRSPSLFNILKHGVLPWIRGIYRRMRYLKDYLKKEKLVRRQDMEVWVPLLNDNQGNISDQEIRMGEERLSADERQQLREEYEDISVFAREEYEDFSAFAHEDYDAEASFDNEDYVRYPMHEVNSDAYHLIMTEQFLFE